IMMRRQQQTIAFALQPVVQGIDFLLAGLRLSSQMVQSEYHQGVGVVEDALVERQPVSRLIHSLEYRHGMSRDLLRDALKILDGAVKQLQGARDRLQKLCGAPL